MLLLPALLAGLALPTAPALAGEDPDDSAATLHEVRDCVSSSRAKFTVTGDDVDSVAFYVNGRLRKSATSPTGNDTYVFAMRCRRLSPGAHRGRAVVTDTGGDTSTLRFTITRAAQGSPRFTG
jgi:hypothetical protein